MSGDSNVMTYWKHSWWAAVCVAALAGCAAGGSESAAVADTHTASTLSAPSAVAEHYRARIVRTEDGVPQILADDWGSLGWGSAYAQAQDDLCTMAQGFVTYRGERSRYFGAQGSQPTSSTLGEVDNLDSDFFFKLVDDDAQVSAYRNAQTPEIRALVDGFAAGYNRYVHDWRAGADSAPRHDACREARWVSDITPDDVYRRLFAANLAGGLARFAGRIATAVPPDKVSGAPSAIAPAASQDVTPHTLALRDGELDVGGGRGIGSNAIAFGAETSVSGRPVLLGNPHWFLEGPDRFYQMRLTLPGKLDVSGVAFLGVPIVMIGFNRDVAWTHTVSAARRFGLFQLKLADDTPTAYVEDGKRVPMTPVPLTVMVRAGDNTVRAVRRTLYRTAMGPVVNLGGMSPALRWQGTQAFVIRDINSSNYRIFANFLAWGQAHSLDEFIAIQRRMSAMPWVNTIAIGRDDPRVWYADVGAVPNVPDTLAAACTPPLGKAFAAQAPGVPFLDGSRSGCQWPDSPGSAQPGALPADQQPQLLRRDYVANMNNTHWIVNPEQPLTGFAAVTGSERTAMGLRPRLGFRMVAQRIAGTDGEGPPGASVDAVSRMALDSRAMSAVMFKTQALDQACAGVGAAGERRVMVDTDPAGGSALPSGEVDIAQACRVLRAWDDTGNPFAQGAVLWDAWWQRIETLPQSARYAVPFDPAHPLDTPAQLHAAPEVLAKMLGVAVVRLRQGGFTPDAERGAALFAVRNGVRIPWFGGCDDQGYFTSGCSSRRIETGGQIIDAQAVANSYLQVVSFGSTAGQLQALTLMAGSQSDDPASPHHVDGTLRYAAKRWVARNLDSPPVGAGQWLDSRTATPAASGASLADRWRVLASGGMPSREAGELMQTSEASLVETELGTDVVRLRATPADIVALLQRLNRLGRIEIMVRTEHGIAERVVSSHVPLFNKAGRAQAGLAMTVDPSQWTRVYAVTRYYGASREAYRQLQFFDGAGRNVAKVHPLDVRRVSDYDALVAALRAPDQHAAAQVAPDTGANDAGPHGLTPACDAGAVEGASVRVALADMLTRAHDAGWALRVEVANQGATLAREGRIVAIENIGGGWLSVGLDGFKLHLRVSGIARACRLPHEQMVFVEDDGAPAVTLAPAGRASAGQRRDWAAAWSAALSEAAPVVQKTAGKTNGINTQP